jgi:DNA polymerase elongation subunit (family B)
LKLLALDIETSGAVVRVFSLYRPMISHEAILEHPRIICWSAQWEGQDEVMFKSEYRHGRKEMLEELHRLITEADAIITYNGQGFDIPWIEGEFITEGMSPSPDVTHIDLYRTIKQRTRFISGKLDYAVSRLLNDRKVPNSGISLWNGCARNDPKSWAEMELYAKQDTALLLPLYYILAPWIKTHPNRGLIEGKINACVVCASENLKIAGRGYTQKKSYPRFQCKDCGKWQPRTFGKAMAIDK